MPQMYMDWLILMLLIVKWRGNKATGMMCIESGIQCTNYPLTLYRSKSDMGSGHWIYFTVDLYFRFTVKWSCSFYTTVRSAQDFNRFTESFSKFNFTESYLSQLETIRLTCPTAEKYSSPTSPAFVSQSQQQFIPMAV